MKEKIANLKSTLIEARLMTDEKTQEIEKQAQNIKEFTENQSTLESTIQQMAIEKEEILIDMQQLGDKMKVYNISLNFYVIFIRVHRAR